MFLDAKKHGKIVKQILVDGQDVTKRCKCVNAEEGWAMLYQTWPPTAEDVRQEVYELKVGKIEVVFTPVAQAALDLGGMLE